MLISTAEAQEQLRVDSEDDVEYIESLIASASEFIRLYLDGGCEYVTGTDGEPLTDADNCKIVKPSIKSACKLLVADLYRFRESTKNALELDDNGLSTTVVALLWPHRKSLGV